MEKGGKEKEKKKGGGGKRKDKNGWKGKGIPQIQQTAFFVPVGILGVQLKPINDERATLQGRAVVVL